MRCNMTFISLESFKNSGLAALRISSEPWQEPSSQDFEAAIADISSQLDQASHNGKAQKEILILPNIVLPILSETCEKEAPKDNQEDTVSVSTQVHFMPDRLMTIQPSVEIPTRIMLFIEPELTVDVEALEDRNDFKTSDVVLSIPVTLPESPHRAIHQKESILRDNEVEALIKTSEPLSSKYLSTDLSLIPSKSLNLAHPRNVQFGEALRLEQNNVAFKMGVDSLNEQVSSVASPAEEIKHRMNVAPHDGILHTVEWRVKISSLPLTQLKATEAKDNKCGTSDPTAVDTESNKISLVHIPEQQGVVKESVEKIDELEPEMWVKAETSITAIELPVSDTAVQVQEGKSGNVLETDAKQHIARTVIAVKDTLLPKELKTLSISLNPEALGQVNVELVSDEAGKIHVNLAVLKAETFETLQQDFSQLKTILNEIGIEDGNVSLQLASGGEDHRHQKEEYVAWEDRESMLVRQPILATIPVEKTQTYPERKSLKRLDIRA